MRARRQSRFSPREGCGHVIGRDNPIASERRRPAVAADPHSYLLTGARPHEIGESRASQIAVTNELTQPRWRFSKRALGRYLNKKEEAA